MDTLVKESSMIDTEPIGAPIPVAVVQDSELVREIKKYLEQFSRAELLDGNQVCDALLDLMLMAQRI